MPKDAADFIKKDLRGTAEEKKQYEASKTENHKKQPDHTGIVMILYQNICVKNYIKKLNLKKKNL